MRVCKNDHHVKVAQNYGRCIHKLQQARNMRHRESCKTSAQILARSIVLVAAVRYQAATARFLKTHETGLLEPAMRPGPTQLAVVVSATPWSGTKQFYMRVRCCKNCVVRQLLVIVKLCRCQISDDMHCTDKPSSSLRGRSAQAHDPKIRSETQKYRRYTCGGCRHVACTSAHSYSCKYSLQSVQPFYANMRFVLLLLSHSLMQPNSSCDESSMHWRTWRPSAWTLQ